MTAHSNLQRNKHQSRPSYNGSDNGVEQSPLTNVDAAQIPRTSSRGSGHARSGSAGNWNMQRSNLNHTSYPLTSAPDVKPSAPWLTDSVGPSRLSSEQTWN